MKVMLIKGQIINLEEIRNVQCYLNSEILIHFRRPANDRDDLMIHTRSHAEATEIISEMYEKMLDK